LESNAENIVQDAKKLVDSVGAEGMKVLTVLYRLLSDGKPVGPERVASALNLPVSEATSIIKKFPTVLDQDGNLVESYGLSLNPTKHNFVIGDNRLYSWCGVDTIFLPILIKKNARIESPDPITGEKIKLHVSPERVEEVEPSTALVTWIAADVVTTASVATTASEIRGATCHYQNFFGSDESASKYISENPRVFVVTPSDVFNAINSALTPYRDIRD